MANPLWRQLLGRIEQKVAPKRGGYFMGRDGQCERLEGEIQKMEDTLQAIDARINGDWTDPCLVEWGHLRENPMLDVSFHVHEVLRDIRGVRLIEAPCSKCGRRYVQESYTFENKDTGFKCKNCGHTRVTLRWVSDIKR
jgi:DNA-directed RNA polymerase subunit RPC12/RpoP